MRASACTNDAAVRKNRYVILPVDFEEAWKVSPKCHLRPPPAFNFAGWRHHSSINTGMLTFSLSTNSPLSSALKTVWTSVSTPILNVE